MHIVNLHTFHAGESSESETQRKMSRELKQWFEWFNANDH